MWFARSPSTKVIKGIKAGFVCQESMGHNLNVCVYTYILTWRIVCYVSSMSIALVLNSTPQIQRQSTTTGRDRCEARIKAHNDRTWPVHTVTAYNQLCIWIHVHKGHSDGTRIQSHCTSTTHYSHEVSLRRTVRTRLMLLTLFPVNIEACLHHKGGKICRCDSWHRTGGDSEHDAHYGSNNEQEEGEKGGGQGFLLGA